MKMLLGVSHVTSSIEILGLLVSDCTWMIQPNLYMCSHSNCNWGNGKANYDKNMSNYFGIIVVLMTMVHLRENCCNYANDNFKLGHRCRSRPAPFKVFFAVIPDFVTLTVFSADAEEWGEVNML